MNKFIQRVMILVAFSALAGCATFTAPARKHELLKNTPYWFDYAADRRGAIMFPKPSSVTICAEPSPDVALDIVSKFDAELQAAKLPAKGKLATEISEKVVQLAKRTQTIMFLRESLYRLCELSANYKLGKADVMAQYTKVIDAAKTLAEAELQSAKQETLEAEADLRKIQAATSSAIDSATKHGR